MYSSHKKPGQKQGKGGPCICLCNPTYKECGTWQLADETERQQARTRATMFAPTSLVAPDAASTSACRAQPVPWRQPPPTCTCTHTARLQPPAHGCRIRKHVQRCAAGEMMRAVRADAAGSKCNEAPAGYLALAPGGGTHWLRPSSSQE